MLRFDELDKDVYTLDVNETILNLKGLPHLTLERVCLYSMVGDVLTTVQELKNKQLITASSHLNFSNFGKHDLKTMKNCPMIIEVYEKEEGEIEVFGNAFAGVYEDIL